MGLVCGKCKSDLPRVAALQDACLSASASEIPTCGLSIEVFVGFLGEVVGMVCVFSNGERGSML